MVDAVKNARLQANKELVTLDRALQQRVDKASKPDAANDHLADLVLRFSAALLEKLRAAETKYGYSDAWARPDWRDDLVKHMLEHIEKGDPRDVAAYCAFAWHHGWSVQPTTPSCVDKYKAQCRIMLGSGM